jgi:hypothetical protein
MLSHRESTIENLKSKYRNRSRSPSNVSGLQIEQIHEKLAPPFNGGEEKDLSNSSPRRNQIDSMVEGIAKTHAIANPMINDGA